METLLENGLIAVFVALLLAPFGLPVPEDISLLVAGVLVHWDKAEVWQALVVGYLGVVIGDCFVWTIGRKVGLHPSGLLPRLVGSEKIERITRFYDRFGDWAIVLCRQVPGLRAPAFF
ncbi:MAG: VTT domain-containing protein, partial [Myxococcota bacterium]|nr:VTT domain-containing protein [Myxococcota bacterium]